MDYHVDYSVRTAICQTFTYVIWGKVCGLRTMVRARARVTSVRVGDEGDQVNHTEIIQHVRES